MNHYKFQSKKPHRKGFTLAALGGIAIIFVVTAIILSFGSQIVGEIRNDTKDATWEKNITTSGLDALAEFADWLPTLAIVVVAGVIIGIVVMYLGRQGGGV